MSLQLPTLTEHTRLRYTLFGLLYTAQGIPEGLIFFAIPAYLAAQDVSALAIAGFISVSSLPWSLKLFNGPIMDRFTFLVMGRRRPWVLIGQTGLTLSFAALAFVGDPAANLGWLTAGCFVVSFFGAFQDVAVDGMAIDVVPIGEQARANGLMWGSKTIGMAASTAGGSLMINAAGFAPAILSFAVLVAGIMMFPLLLRERPGERMLPWTKGTAAPETAAIQLDGWRDIGVSLFRAFALPTSLILALLGFAMGMGRGFTEALLPIYTVQGLDWADTTFSQLMATAHLVGGLAGMTIGGYLIDRLGRTRTLTGFLAGLVVVNVVMSLWLVGRPDPATVGSYIYGFAAFDTLANIALFATAMGICWQRVSATQFALYMAIGNLGMTTGAALLGGFTTWLDYPKLFLTLAVVPACGIILVRFLRLEHHPARLDRLDADYASVPV